MYPNHLNVSTMYRSANGLMPCLKLINSFLKSYTQVFLIIYNGLGETVLQIHNFQDMGLPMEFGHDTEATVVSDKQHQFRTTAKLKPHTIVKADTCSYSVIINLLIAKFKHPYPFRQRTFQ